MLPQNSLARSLDREDELDAIDAIDLLDSQSAPLLANQNASTQSVSRTPGSNLKSGSSNFLDFSRLPLWLGGFFLVALLGLIHMTLKESEDIALTSYNDTSIPDVSSPVVEELDLPTYPLIDYSNYTSFPLTPLQYEKECWIQLQHNMYDGPYWSEPPQGVADVRHPIQKPGVCSSSITYLLDGSSSGVVAELAIIAQIAGIARERGKTLFVNDQYWNRGKWSEYFRDTHVGQPGPEPGCRPPPPEELVACPRLARHWVVTFRTAKFHLGHGFADEYEDARSRGIQRQRTIYQRTWLSFQHTILPNANLSTLIASALTELVPEPSVRSLPPMNGSYISVHIRRGDMTSQSWRYHGQPVPLSEFTSVLAEEQAKSPVPLPVYVASDSSEASDSFIADQPEGMQIFSLRTSKQQQLQKLAYPSSRSMGYFQKDWKDERMVQWSDEERKRSTLGVLVDLSVLSGIWCKDSIRRPRSVICATKSTICKMMAIGLGFDHAFGDERGLQWVEIDAKGDVEPVWEAFSLTF